MQVYLITNLVNGKYYVGKTVKKSLRRYLKNACSMARAGKDNRLLLHRAIRKHGPENFIIEMLTDCETNSQACLLERAWIAALDSRNISIGYNVSAGGEGTPGIHPSPETLAKLSAWRKGRPTWNKGLTGIHTPEGKRSMSEKRIGELNPFFGKSHKGDRTSASVAAANAKRIWTPEMKQHMSEVKKGSVHTAAVIEKMKAAAALRDRARGGTFYASAG
jgi:group I intron endonuclease